MLGLGTSRASMRTKAGTVADKEGKALRYAGPGDAEARFEVDNSGPEPFQLTHQQHQPPSGLHRLTTCLSPLVSTPLTPPLSLYFYLLYDPLDALIPVELHVFVWPSATPPSPITIHLAQLLGLFSLRHRQMAQTVQTVAPQLPS